MHRGKNLPTVQSRRIDCVIAEVKERCPCLCEETQCGPDDTLCNVLPKADCQYISCGLLSSPFFAACSLWGGGLGGEGSGKERAYKALTVGKKWRWLRPRAVPGCIVEAECSTTAGANRRRRAAAVRRIAKGAESRKPNKKSRGPNRFYEKESSE